MNTFESMSIYVLWGITLFDSLLILSLIRKLNTSPKKPATLKQGTEAPDFTLKSLAGEELSKSDYSNRQFGLIFVSSTCQPCRQFLPAVDRLYHQARYAGVELMTVCLDNAEATMRLVQELGFSAPMFLSADPTTLRDKYKVAGTPSFCIVDNQGKVKEAGFIDEKWGELAEGWAKVTVPANEIALAN